MQYRISSFLILALLFISNAGLAASPPKNSQQAFLRQFATSRVAFPDEKSPYSQNSHGTYPSSLKFLFKSLLAWAPTGEGKELSAKCASETWGRRLQDPRVSKNIALQGALIQKYLKDCEEELKTGTSSSLSNLAKMLSMRYDPQDHPFYHRVVFSLPGNIRLKGLLGLKGDFKKRPLVVIRLGIFANVEEFIPDRAWMMMLFEQSPFNVLVLENMTGSDFIANNTRFSFGGYDEGIQNILIGQILRDPNEPLSRLVDSLHLFGISLGGNGVLHASLLNELNSPKSGKLYQSFFGMCPVVNLEQTMKNLTEDGLFAKGVDLWSQARMAGLPSKLPVTDDHEAFQFLKKAVSEVVRTYQGGLSYVSSVRLPEGVQDEDGFWPLNDFWPHYKNVQQPVMVMANHTDVLVPYEINSGALQSKALKVDSQNFSVVDFKEGIHCTLPIAYDWKAISTLVQSYVLSHSPGFKLKENTFEMELGDEGNSDFYRQALKVHAKVARPQAKESFVKVSVDFKDKKNKTETMKLSLPLSQFDFRFLNEDLSDSEQEMIERWVNQNLNLQVLQKDQKSYLKASWWVTP